ncbi:SOS response-associated peptidase [Chryseolinea sp. T2]|uniref:SOS response-associated peptidase n=1 Tax=Chryseolinea sp. T2 TaxID=3129255 RepID=UPI003077DE3D
MCYHKSQTNSIDYLAEYYSVSYTDLMAELYQTHYHENGFDFLSSPIVTTENQDQLSPFNWGLIPWWTKGLDAGLKLRVQTLNCISEEMYEKPAFRDSAKEGKRCLIPCSGFFEWRWMDEKGKSKVPYYISMPGKQVFSIAGLYSTYRDRSTDQRYQTYTVLTTRANGLMEKIHNSKKRMPVIIPREYEKDWLNPSLSEQDVLALCQPLENALIEGHTISKLITNKKEETDVPRVLEPESYPEVIAADNSSPEAAEKSEPKKKAPAASSAKSNGPKSSGKSITGQTELF